MKTESFIVMSAACASLEKHQVGLAEVPHVSKSPDYFALSANAPLHQGTSTPSPMNQTPSRPAFSSHKAVRSILSRRSSLSTKVR